MKNAPDGMNEARRRPFGRDAPHRRPLKAVFLYAYTQRPIRRPRKAAGGAKTGPSRAGGK